VAGSKIAPIVGRLLVIGFEGTEMTAGLRNLLARAQPAGVILFARNVVRAEQTCELLRECRATLGRPCLTCVDMEGGRVDRFRQALGPAPSAAEVFATGNRKLFRRHGRVIGDCCRALGFNVDLAPVVDLDAPASRPVMRSRVVSADPARTVLYAREFLAGLRQSGVAGALKHFPGLGEANLDTHHELARVSKPWKKLWAEDLAPYRALGREAAMVLISHAAYPEVTAENAPASLSRRWIGQILRQKIGYRGLVLSDDLEMGAVLKVAPTERAAVEFIRAGGDLCLICHKEEAILRSLEALIGEAERDRRFMERVKQSAARVSVFLGKTKSRRPAGRLTSPKVEKLSRQLWEFGEQVRLEAIRGQDSA